MTDKRVLHIFSVAIFASLLFPLFVSFDVSGRTAAAVLLLTPAVLMPLFVKKRSILSIHKNQVLLLLAVIALLYVMGYYISGIPFGFYKNPYRLTVSNFFSFLLPSAAVIVFTEIIRYVTLAQRDKLSSVLCWLSCVLAEVLLYSNIPSVATFNRFMTLMAGAFFPAVVANCLYHYLSRQYGMYPNLAYRLITTLYLYVFPIASGISDSLLNFLRILLPIAIYYFIDSLFAKKRRYALQKANRFSRVASKVLSVLAVILMTGTIMLVSNHFYYGAYVIASESMTGELNKGDVVIYEQYEDQFIPSGQVVIFKKNNSVTIHRVVDIQIINGVTRYYTKGDANEDMDDGFVTDGEILGLVDYKLPGLGYPTLWIRDMFTR